VEDLAGLVLHLDAVVQVDLAALQDAGGGHVDGEGEGLGAGGVEVGQVLALASGTSRSLRRWK
jgi:hypothetical protein